MPKDNIGKHFKEVNSQTDFPLLERNLLDKWKKEELLNKYLHKNDKKEEKFSFLDGPITANNPMGVHHAWGRTYKDFWQKYWNMQGRRQRFQNGFDEQGLWVEVEVEKELGLKSKKDIENLVSGDKFKSLEKFINLCKARVAKFSAVQTEQSKRLGYFMDWENSYHTSSEANNYAIWNFLKVVNEKGWLYKGHDSVPWCPRCGTAISQHEILTEEYKELTHESIFFKLPIKGKDNEYLLVWTTTPWTIPSNVAVAVNKKEKYSQYVLEGQKLWLMDKRVKPLEKEKILSGGELGESFSGTELIGWEYDGPFDDLPLVKDTLSGYTHAVIDGEDIVTEEEGTGLLHVAPGAGEEDFKLGIKNKLPVIGSIEEDASYLAGMGDFSGKNAKWEPQLVIDYLKDKEGGKYLLTTQMYKHRYPTCWRCKTELVWRVVDEWYIGMDKKDKSGQTYREQMMDVTKKINWLPSWGLDRELDWLKNMHDWLISKKRYWGLALPIWECKECGNFEVLGGKEELEERAVEGWKEFEGNSPHRPWIDQIKIKCSKCQTLVSRIPDVGNPWLDAGIVPFSTLPEGFFPADFITESFPGQFKNWFYSLIAMSTALKKTNPFKNILGFASVRDERGEEMHKSKGNSIEFNEAADKIGVDVMRWLYLRQDPEINLNFGYHVADEVRRYFHLRLWNIYSFFVTYANLNNWKPKKSDLPLENILDKWIISRLNESIKNVKDYVESYQPDKAAADIENFIINDLSNWYVRRSRDRVAIYNENEKDKEACLLTLWHVLSEYSKLLAPFNPYISEEMYVNLTGGESVHLSDFPSFDKELIDEKLQEQMQKARKIAEALHALRKAREVKVRIPIREAKYSGPSVISDEVLKVVKEEINVYELSYDKKLQDYVVEAATNDENLDLNFGLARDIVRKIQEQRKNLGTSPDQKVNVTLAYWPKEYEEFIKKRAQVDKLVEGKEFSIS
jgi:isoleucyl-tRNA synthetase